MPVPIRSLTAFQRVHLAPGEVKTVEFTIAPDSFSIINDKNEKQILPGEFGISVGGGQPDVPNANVLKTQIKLL